MALVPILLAASFTKPKHIRPSANPSQYTAFSTPLPQNLRISQTLARLTFGPRPGDAQAVTQLGIQKWIEFQLHPNQIPENPAVTDRLAPLTSLGMSAHDAALHFPPPQLIRAVARGNAKLPDDPELRVIVSNLAARYLKKADNKVPVDQKVASDSDDDVSLQPKIRLNSIITADQIQLLRTGSNPEKKSVLASIPPDHQLEFVWALRPGQRKQLFNLAPVALQRQLILSVSPQRVVADDLTEGKLIRAVYSNRQLEELLVDFWFNHFNVFLDKGADHYLVPTYERESIRPYVLGKFYDLLLATAKSPAMLFYLDNWQSVGPDVPQHGNVKRGLNENYGRELLELHTLGVDGGYTQKDIIDVARCFTGWTIAAPRKGGAFEYNDKLHDKGAKVVLGHTIPAGGGMDDGLQVLSLLAHSPTTAHFISLQLAKRFVADDPPPSLVNRMAETFLKKDGDLREVTRTMLQSPEFWSQGAYRAKVKSPFEMVASALRATGADVSSAFALEGELQKLGEPLYRKIEPTGYSNLNAEWVSSSGLVDRFNFSLTLASNHLNGITVNPDQWRDAATDPLGVATRLLQTPPGQQTVAALTRPQASPRSANDVVGMILGSPEFQRR